MLAQVAATRRGENPLHLVDLHRIVRHGHRPGWGLPRPSRQGARPGDVGAKSLDALLPALYLRGVSTGDFLEALAALLSKDAPNLSPTVISRLTAEWQTDYDAWQKRADGVYLQARMEEAAECMLVLIGATPEGKKELVGFQTGVRENAQSWRELLIDIKQHGLKIAPDLAVGDGALGFWKAIEQVFPSTRHQRCWVHKTANVLNKVALSVQVNMKVDLREIYGAPTRAATEAAIDVFADKARQGGRLSDQGPGSSPPNTGTICARQIRSRACSRRCVIEP